jgi:hypothetical protein
MTVRRAPSPPSFKIENMDERTEAFINKGMQSKTVKPLESTEPPKPIKVLLTIPAESHSRIGAVLADRKVRIPRHTWILEAIAEKLDREERKPM